MGNSKKKKYNSGKKHSKRHSISVVFSDINDKQQHFSTIIQQLYLFSIGKYVGEMVSSYTVEEHLTRFKWSNLNDTVILLLGVYPDTLTNKYTLPPTHTHTHFTATFLLPAKIWEPLECSSVIKYYTNYCIAANEI